jgi:hypothetical protein
MCVYSQMREIIRNASSALLSGGAMLVASCAHPLGAEKPVTLLQALLHRLWEGHGTE